MEYLKELTLEEKTDLAKQLWSRKDMQDYLVGEYDFYKTSDNIILRLQKINKISIDKTMYYDDETEAPAKTENNFILYNRYNIPGRDLEEYLREKERLNNDGCASGQYDYQGIYFQSINEKCSACYWHYKHDKYFQRYLTEEEEKEYIELMLERKEKYIERLKKYWKRYGKHVQTHGYWANR